jgi:wobble nucleotide-excising tRNase
MLHKIEELKSIGKFRNYQANGQVNFHKLNLIFGDNGSGKTTLTSVFRSLATNKPEIILNRKSTNSTTQPSAKISQSGNPRVVHNFSSNNWSASVNDIEIFDIHFINENVYSGFEFNDEHKKHLHEFVIGAQGVSLQQQIEQNKRDKVTVRQSIVGIEQLIVQSVGNGLTVELLPSYVRIGAEKAENIDSKIATAETTLSNANSNSVIRSRSILNPLALISSSINFDSLLADLRLTSQQIQDNTLELLFRNHCKELTENGINDVENWLQKGFSYVHSKKETITAESSENLKCPFCSQTIDDSLGIIKAYTLQFNEAFNELVNKIKNYLNLLQSSNLDNALQSISSINQNNVIAINSWKSHLSDDIITPIFNIAEDEEAIKSELNRIQAAITQKLQNPSGAVYTDSVTSFKTVLERINNNISEYNKVVQNYNTAISTFKNNIKTVEQAQNELSILKRIKKRIDTYVSGLCNQLTAKKTELRTHEQAYTQLVQQQVTNSAQFFGSYKDRINHYLSTVFKTPFRIENVEHIAPQGRAIQSKLGYKLTIEGLDISFAPNQALNAKDCLSEGDKSTIALAFFMSKLDIDANRQNKILVFDDPLSSLDTNRKIYTIGIIKELFQHMKQVIVLSHNEYFLHEISKNISNSDKKTFRIIENFQTKESKLELCDLDELVKNDYFKHIEAMENFRTNPDLNIKDSVLGWLRNVLEAHLRFKFYKDIRTMTGQGTFGNLINHLDSSGIIFKDNGNRVSIILKLKLINSVSWKPHHGTAAPDFATLGVNPNSISVPELDGLIQDTLNLIETQL